MSLLPQQALLCSIPTPLADVPLDYISERLRKFRKWIEHVVVTGGEPTIHKGLPEVLQALKEQGLKVKLDRTGRTLRSSKASLHEGLIDYIAMDVKGPLSSYERWCGTDVDKERIRESIDFILEGRVDYEFRMTVVPFLHHEQDAIEVAREIRNCTAILPSGVGAEGHPQSEICEHSTLFRTEDEDHAGNGRSRPRACPSLSSSTLARLLLPVSGKRPEGSSQAGRSCPIPFHMLKGPTPEACE